MNILVTGGLGFIGSSTILELSKTPCTIHILDNLENSNLSTYSTLQSLLPSTFLLFHKGDITDLAFLSQVFQNKIDLVFHFAALKSTINSNKSQLKYQETNIKGTQNLLHCMKKFSVNQLIFSSSASLYKESKFPLNEESEISPLTIYAKTKLINEKMIQSFARKHKNFKSIIFRYFNPAGAHCSGLIGEFPVGNNGGLFENIQQVALGRKKRLIIYGKDFDSFDGTSIRDFVHVSDLAKANALAMDRVKRGVQIFNFGSGGECSVMEVVKTYERISEVEIKVEIGDKREGDLERSVADISKFVEVFEWKPEKNLEDICRDSWRFVKKVMVSEVIN